MRKLPIVLALVAALLPALPCAAAADEPAVCTHDAGALPVDTLPPGAPHGAAIPIDHVVVLMQENRSFDHYFARLHAKDADRAARKATNPDPLGGPPIRAFRNRRYCEVADLSHSWNGTHRSWNGGAMDGFTAENVHAADPSGRRAMGYYTANDLGFYFDLYGTFAIGDRHFSSVPGPTYPNRHYLLAGTSFGHIRNDLPASGSEFSQRTIFNALDEAGIGWKIYQSQVAFALLYSYVRTTGASHLVPIADYFTDAAAGTLPQVAFIDPIFVGSENQQSDEHPPANVQVGQAFVASVVNALLASPAWPRSALFLTYDEHGGFYDHVPPPQACKPDDVAPMLRANDEPGDFDRYGIRVPLVVVSPFARKRYVSHVVSDATSVLRFIETRFDLPALTRRDANASPLLDYFDFAAPPFVKPPKLRPARIDPRHAAECEG